MKKENRIDSSEKYNSLFTVQEGETELEGSNDISNKKEKALEHALDIRKFEIDLYWKRATYFWTFNGAIFAGFFLLLSRMEMGNNNSLSNGITIFSLSCIGLVLTWCWFLVNRGSKFWQNNWEKHVDMLEDDIIGPLYKTVINMQSTSFWNFNKEYPYSVSKINQLLSLFISIIWLFFATWASIFFHLFYYQKLLTIALSTLTVAMLITVSFAGKSTYNLNKNTKDNREIFIKRDKYLS